MSECRFGVSPVNYPDPDPDRAAKKVKSGIQRSQDIFSFFLPIRLNSVENSTRGSVYKC